MPCLPFRVQSLENEALRKSLRMVPGKHSGLYVKEVAKHGALAGTLREGDVIMQVNGSAIGNDMTVRANQRPAPSHPKTPGRFWPFLTAESAVSAAVSHPPLLRFSCATARSTRSR
jgi:hypothetical protein